MKEKIKLLRTFLDKHNLALTSCNCCDGISLEEITEDGKQKWEQTRFEHYPSNCEVTDHSVRTKS